MATIRKASEIRHNFVTAQQEAELEKLSGLNGPEAMKPTGPKLPEPVYVRAKFEDDIPKPEHWLIAAAAFFIGGFIFMPLFLGVPFVFYRWFMANKEEPARRAEHERLQDELVESDKKQRELRRTQPISVEDIRICCESPAETAFLDAMVAEYELQTGAGAARGKGLSLNSQVEMIRYDSSDYRGRYQYRADFVVDDNLVVEIDGATYHSSPEAVARDDVRNTAMRAEGYWVLRLPAKLVFRDPHTAVKCVERARLTKWIDTYGL